MKLFSGTILLIASIILVSCDAFIDKETLYLKEKTDPTCYRYVYTYNEANKLTQAQLYFGEKLGSTTDFIYEGGKLIEAIHEIYDAKLISHTYLEYNEQGLRIKETIISNLNGVESSPAIRYYHYYPNNYLKSKSYTTNYDGYTSEIIREYEWRDGNLVKEITKMKTPTITESIAQTREYIYDNKRSPYNQDLGFNYISGEGDETYFSKNNLTTMIWYNGNETLSDRVEFSFKYNKNDYPAESLTPSRYYSNYPLYFRY